MKKMPRFCEIRHWIQDFRRDVIRMMRLKFIMMAMSILVAVFLVMLGSINMIMQTVSQSQSMRLLEQIARSERYNAFDGNSDTVRQQPGENAIMPLAWGGENERNRRPEMPDDFADAGQDGHRPPEWGNSGWQQPSGEIVPTEEPVQPEPPVQEESAVPPEMPSEPGSVQEASVETSSMAVREETPGTAARPEAGGFVPEMPPEESDGETRELVPPEMPPEPQNPPEPREPRMDRWNVSVTIDHFAIMADAQGQLLGIRNTEDYDETEAAEILDGILAEDKTQGMYGWLQFCRAEKPYGTLLVITDKTSDQGLLNNLYRTTVIIGIVMLLVLLGVVIVLSKWITDPVRTAFVRQKQFVSDAGHELKTPISVLTANADILQDEIGENKWLGYMQEQIGRMGQLVGDLLRLARMDNAAVEYTFADFDLSMAIAATTLPFESAAYEQQRNLEMDIQPDIRYHGSEQHIRQLCAIFIDNAIKYSNENGVIKVTLLKRGEHSVLEFYNTGCDISQEETEKIFERFYRGDKSRKIQGKSGYGLGLAIAKSIMEVHRIRIQVTCEQGKWIRFLLTL